jgi:hypothetical protein
MLVNPIVAESAHGHPGVHVQVGGPIAAMDVMHVAGWRLVTGLALRPGGEELLPALSVFVERGFSSFAHARESAGFHAVFLPVHADVGVE